MGVVARAKKRRLQEEEEEEEEDLVDDRISHLPDGVLGDIVSFLPTKDGARTQILSSRWRPIWRSAAALNIESPDPARGTPLSAISGILSAHRGPGAPRFSVHNRCLDHRILDGWLRSPALDGLRELEIHFDHGPLRWGPPPPPLPASALRRFSSTLAVASFGSCVFPDCRNSNDDDAGALRLPLLKQLSLVNVRISETSLHALLAGCPALQSLLLLGNPSCFDRVRIVSPSLRSIGVGSSWGEMELQLQQLVIEDAPCLERLLFSNELETMDISVISAPRLAVLGELDSIFHRLQFGTTILQGSTALSLKIEVVPNVKVLALSGVKPCLDAVIDLMKCFPHLEKLYIKIMSVGDTNVSCHKYRKLIGTLDIRLRKIVVANYQGSESSHINFAKFFVLNASVLDSMRLEIQVGHVGDGTWISTQRRLLQIKRRASRGAQFDFVSGTGSFSLLTAEQVHDLSILDPFQRFH